MKNNHKVFHETENDINEVYVQLRTIRLEPEWHGLDTWIYGA